MCDVCKSLSETNYETHHSYLTRLHAVAPARPLALGRWPRWDGAVQRVRAEAELRDVECPSLPDLRLRCAVRERATAHGLSSPEWSSSRRTRSGLDIHERIAIVGWQRDPSVLSHPTKRITIRGHVPAPARRHADGERETKPRMKVLQTSEKNAAGWRGESAAILGEYHANQILLVPILR